MLTAERSWACFGYFTRLLDTSNISMSDHQCQGINSQLLANAYVSGMREVSGSHRGTEPDGEKGIEPTWG